MNDKEFLIWIYRRLTNVHGENELLDYMHKFRAIIKDYPKDKITIKADPYNDINAMLKDTANVAA